jgi:hypothetical protein
MLLANCFFISKTLILSLLALQNHTMFSELITQWSGFQSVKQYFANSIRHLDPTYDFLQSLSRIKQPPNDRRLADLQPILNRYWVRMLRNAECQGRASIASGKMRTLKNSPTSRSDDRQPGSSSTWGEQPQTNLLSLQPFSWRLPYLVTS